MTDTINVPATVPATTPATTTAVAEPHANPFKALALLLKAVRESLEGSKTPGQAPRWVRIARIRKYQGESDYISKAIIPAVDKGFAFTLVYLSHLTLQAKDLLFQADAAKALIEVSGEMLKTVTKDDFAQALTEVVGMKGVSNPLSGAGGIIDTVLTFVDKVPDPEDLDLIGQQLYAMLCIQLLPLEETGLGKGTLKHIDVEASGKVRLLEMALNKPITIRGLGKDKSQTQEITFLGGRRVWQAAADQLPARAAGEWTDGKEVETIYDFDLAAGADLEELNNLLEKMGYLEPAVGDKKVFSDTVAQRLRRFQKLNELSITGKLDNPTLNRLMHLDFEAKNLQRANPFDQAQLGTFDDTKNPS